MMHAPVSPQAAAKPQQELISGPYVRNAWYVAAWSDDISAGQVAARTIMN